MTNEISNSGDPGLRRTLLTVLFCLGAVLFLLLLWYAAETLLLTFAGILLAILFRTLSDWLSRLTHLSAGWSFLSVMVVLILFAAASIWLLAPEVATQVDQLIGNVPRAASQLTQSIERYQWGRQIVAHLSGPGFLISNRTDFLTRITGAFSTTLGLLGNLAIFLFMGTYFAIQPELYQRGLVQLFPASRRPRAHEVLNALGFTLRWWLLGRLISMVVIGGVTAAGLFLLNVPLALTLGLLAAFLNFIPNIGPLLSVIPAALLALTQSPTRALYVLVLYIAVQVVETYLLTPYVQKRTLSMPPVLTLIAQVVFGVLFGWLGLVLATPLAASALVITKMLYVEDILGGQG